MNTQKVILGVDPGTNLLGYGIIAVNNKEVKYLDMGVLDIRKIKDPYDKLHSITRKITDLCKKYSPAELAIESPFYGKNAQVILKLGRAQGAAIVAAKSMGLDVFEYAPRKAKIAITGVGSSSKEQVSNMIQKSLNIELNSEFLDATDALAIALCHHYQSSNPLASSSKSSGNWEAFILSNPDRVVKR